MEKADAGRMGGNKKNLPAVGQKNLPRVLGRWGDHGGGAG